jgi:hypothetical protein
MPPVMLDGIPVLKRIKARIPSSAATASVTQTPIPALEPALRPLLFFVDGKAVAVPVPVTPAAETPELDFEGEVLAVDILSPDI